MIRRRLFAHLPALSLLLCVATCALWLRTLWVADRFRWTAVVEVIPARVRGEGKLQFPDLAVERQAVLTWEPGRFELAVERRLGRADRPAKPFTYESNRTGRGWTDPLIRGYRRLPLLPGVYGSFPTEEDDGVNYGYRLAVHPWVPAALFAFIPAWRAGRRAKAWQEKRQILRSIGPPRCRRCGYDLRASPGRCPECGEEQSLVGSP